MLCDLIIDGNFILSKLVFTLDKQKMLYGLLERSLENSLNNFKSWYPFTNIYLVSDSKEKSWRMDHIKQYKAKRVKNQSIDWEFVYQTYSDFKNSQTRIKVLEYPKVEGDDWISYICKKSNEEGRSTIIIANDYDIKQLLNNSLEPLYMNIMTNEMQSRGKVFFPTGYKLFIERVRKIPSGLFEMNYNVEFLELIDDLCNRHEIVEVDSVEELFVKYVSGDTSDNIDAVWFKISDKGRKTGIGDKGARKMYKKYIEYFGDVDLDDPELYDNIADVVCESKKLSVSSEFDKIVKNLEYNSMLVDLRMKFLPDDIKDNIIRIYDERN